MVNHSCDLLAADQVEPSTWRRYEAMLRVHLLPALGGMKITKIRPAHVQTALDAIDRSPRTVQHCRALLSKMFRQATMWGLIASSPVPPTSAPKAEKPDLTVPDAEGAKALMAAAVGTRWEMPVLLAAYTGARRGEVLAIGWDRVDLDRRRIKITRSVERLRGEFRFKEPKTKRGEREVAVPPFVVERLRRWKIAQNQRRLEAGPRLAEPRACLRRRRWRSRQPGCVHQSAQAVRPQGGSIRHPIA